jgi:aspartate carbamoyltransferase
MKHLMTVEDVTNEDLLRLFRSAESMQTGIYRFTKGNFMDKILCPLFLEPSTRTRHSFESAMIRLGGNSLSAPTPEMLSINKGESISDTLKTESCYCDIMVVRAPVSYFEWFNFDMDYCGIPIINAGDGPYNHPTQAMLDAYTIWERYGHEDRTSPFAKRHLKHLIIGDLGHSRTIRSYVELMRRAAGHEFYAFDSTNHSHKIESVHDNLKVEYVRCERDIVDLLPSIDVVYLNRVQTERWKGGPRCYSFEFNTTMMNKLKDDAVVLNPGPRQEELPVHLTNWNNVKMWEQVRNGLYLRMSLISMMLGKLPDRMYEKKEAHA